MEKDHPFRFWHESFDKGYYVYGMHLAKKSILKYRKAILVEGEFDVMRLHSEGLTMTVGVSGSAFSSFQASIILRYCSELYLVFDGDTSGQNAAKRSMKVYQTLSPLTKITNPINFIPVYLPSKMDPDDFVSDVGRDGFIKYLKDTKENASLFK